MKRKIDVCILFVCLIFMTFGYWTFNAYAIEIKGGNAGSGGKSIVSFFQQRRCADSREVNGGV